MKAATDLTGLWSLEEPDPQQTTAPPLDNGAAIAAGYVLDDGTPLPHGTYPRIQYFCIWMSDKDPVANGVLDIFAEDGTFGRFISADGSDTWEYCAEAVEFTAPGNTPTSTADQTLTRYPTLILDHDVSTFQKDGKTVTVSRPFIRSAGDGSSALQGGAPAQRLVRNPRTAQVSWISDSDPDGALMYSVFRQPSGIKDGANDGKTFDDTFHGQVNLGQLQFPFYGFKPLAMDLYTGNTFSSALPGTQPKSYGGGNLRQSFNGTLIFKFPANDSMDYVRQGDIDGTPYFPLGVKGYLVSALDSSTRSRTMKSVSDRVRSWSVTLGLSAGIEGMFDADTSTTYGSRIERQQTEECRYTTSREIDQVWAEFADIPVLQLHDDLVNQIKDATYQLLNGGQPQWHDFVETVGTHYGHAFTQGSIEVTETHFSLDSENTACTNNVDLEVSATAVVDGIKGGTDDKYASEWKDSTGIEITAQDVETLGVGTPGPNVTIFFDLRPISELLSPVFVPYDPADPWLRYAPWVWTKVRQAFDAYLATLGMDQPIDASFLTDFTPHKYKVTFPSVSVQGGDWLPGDISFTLSAPEGAAGEIVRTINNWSWNMPDPDNQPHYISWADVASGCDLTVLVRGGTDTSITFDVDVEAQTWNRPGERWVTGPTFSLKQTVELARRTKLQDGTYQDVAQPATTISQAQDGCTLEIQVTATDVGLDFPDVVSTFKPPAKVTGAGVG